MLWFDRVGWGCGTIYSMKTVVTGGVEVGGGARRKVSWLRRFFSWIAWVYDRFVFHVIYRGRRLRPEVLERLEREDEEERQGKQVRSPTFTNAEDAIKWLKS